jgi:putative metallopeptidase-like protein
MAPAEAEAPHAVAAVHRALKDVELALPHLTGLARAVRVVEDPRVGTLGVFRSGRLLVNPAWFLTLDRPAARFAVAHELLHLALRTHERAVGSDLALFNLAHDAIINDMLVEALGGLPAAGGFWLSGARHRAAEEVVAELRRDVTDYPGICDSWRAVLRDPGSPTETALGAALRAAGLVSPPSPSAAPSDLEHVLSDELEARWFPRDDSAQLDGAREALRAAGAAAVRLESLTTGFEQTFRAAGMESDDEEADIVRVEAIPTLEPPPWEAALQRWLDAAGPGPRSYARPSRRGADRSDIVLVGRRREERRLHVVLERRNLVRPQ